MDLFVPETDGSAERHHEITTQWSNATIRLSKVTNSNPNSMKIKKDKRIRVKIEKYNEAILRANSMKRMWP